MEKEFRKITLTFGIIMAVLGALVIWRGVTKMIPVTGYEIHYYGFGRPSFRNFVKPAGENWRVEVIDTWNMTITDAGVHSGKFRIALPGHEYMAVRLTRA